MTAKFYQALLVVGCAFSLLTLTACERTSDTDVEVDDGAVEVESETETEGVLGGDTPAEDTITVMEGDAVDGVVDSLTAPGDGQ
jgi:hypothetical protein